MNWLVTWQWSERSLWHQYSQLASTEENSHLLLTLKSKHKHKLEQKFKEMFRIHTSACIFRQTSKYIKLQPNDNFESRWMSEIFKLALVQQEKWKRDKWQISRRERNHTLPLSQNKSLQVYIVITLPVKWISIQEHNFQIVSSNALSQQSNQMFNSQNTFHLRCEP